MRITFNKLNRRTHLYLGLALAPWFLIYAASSVVLNHRDWFEPAGGAQPEWTTRFDRAYRLPPLSDDTNEDLMAEQILRDNGLTGRYRYHWDEAENFVVQRTRLLRTIRFTWFPRPAPAAGRGQTLPADRLAHRRPLPRRLRPSLLDRDRLGRLY